jgi:antitoxin (DNA-binding transcriptional repressor) of toxin-antitoxin stability system
LRSGLACYGNKGHNYQQITVKEVVMKVSMQEFKSHLAQYVRETKSGNILELTSHRKVVARLVGVPQAESVGISRLLAAGVATWKGGKPKGAALSLQTRHKTVSEMILEDRG